MNHQPPDPDHEFAAMAARLDALACEDKAGAPAGLESSIHASTVALLQRADETYMISEYRPAVRTRRWSMAAAAALAATLGAAWLAQRSLHPTAAPTIAATTENAMSDEALLALAGWDHPASDNLDELWKQADTLDQAIRAESDVLELLGDEGAT